MLGGDHDREAESDGEVGGTGVRSGLGLAGVLRQIRCQLARANREYHLATPSPQGKSSDRGPSQGDPVKGMSSKAKNVASRRLPVASVTSLTLVPMRPRRQVALTDYMYSDLMLPGPQGSLCHRPLVFYEKDNSRKIDTHRPIPSHFGLPQGCSCNNGRKGPSDP
jgi:hypothetical protein